MMVVGGNEMCSGPELSPIEVLNGLPVTLQAPNGFFKGIVEVVEHNQPTFIVAPRLDINNQPMGKPIEVSWHEMTGEGATVKLFPRS